MEEVANFRKPLEAELFLSYFDGVPARPGQVQEDQGTL